MNIQTVYFVLVRFVFRMKFVKKKMFCYYWAKLLNGICLTSAKWYIVSLSIGKVLIFVWDNRHKYKTIMKYAVDVKKIAGIGA